jgi:hypothetical protein
MNGTHRKLKLVLKAITVDERAYVRELTTNAANPWEAKLDELTAIDKHLLAVGITVLQRSCWSERSTLHELSHTTSLYRYSRPTDRFSIEDISPLFDAIKLLTYGLPHIFPTTIRDVLVQNKHGPAELSFQAALYSAFNGLLPTSMICLFEAKAKDREQLDLLVVSCAERPPD